jgi:hypothetical protein
MYVYHIYTYIYIYIRHQHHIASLFSFNILCCWQNYTYTPNKALGEDVTATDAVYSACSSQKKRKASEDGQMLVQTSSGVRRSSSKRLRASGKRGDVDEEGDAYTEDMYTIADSADNAEAMAVSGKKSDGKSHEGDGSVCEGTLPVCSRVLDSVNEADSSPERCVLQFGEEPKVRASSVSKKETPLDQQDMAEDDLAVGGKMAREDSDGVDSCLEQTLQQESNVVQGTPLRRSSRIRNIEVCFVLTCTSTCTCACHECDEWNLVCALSDAVADSDSPLA